MAERDIVDWVVGFVYLYGVACFMATGLWYGWKSTR